MLAFFLNQKEAVIIPFLLEFLCATSLKQSLGRVWVNSRSGPCHSVVLPWIGDCKVFCLYSSAWVPLEPHYLESAAGAAQMMRNGLCK